MPRIPFGLTGNRDWDFLEEKKNIQRSRFSYFFSVLDNATISFSFFHFEEIQTPPLSGLLFYLRNNSFLNIFLKYVKNLIN